MTNKIEHFRNAVIAKINSHLNVKVFGENGYDFYTYEKEDGTYCYCIISHKASKAFAWHYFRKESLRNEQFEKYRAMIQHMADTKKRQAEKRKEEKQAMANEINTGDILVSSWGYDQTNVDFYKVIEKKGMTVKLQAMGQTIMDAWNGGGKTMPTEKLYGDVITKRISAGYVKINTSAYAYRWTGEARTFTNYA